MSTRWSWAQVCARRLERHGLSAPVPDATPADVVEAMCGAHAQVPSAAELSVGLRLTEATRVDVREALWTECSLGRTFGSRRTVHLLASRDLPMWTGALSSLPTARNGLPEDARLTPGQTDQVVAAIGAALHGEELTVDELTAAVVAATGPWAGDGVIPAWQGIWPRWRQAIGAAANRGVLCFGRNRGRTVTYTNPRAGCRPRCRGRARRLWPISSAATCTRTARPRRSTWPGGWPSRRGGPRSGSRPSARTWSRSRGARRGSPPATPSPPPPPPPEGCGSSRTSNAYTVGCHPRRLLFPGRAADRALARGQGGNFPVLLIDGTVAGVWHQRRAGRRIEVTLDPLDPLTPAQCRGLDQQGRAGRYDPAGRPAPHRRPGDGRRAPVNRPPRPCVRDRTTGRRRDAL